MLEKTPKLDVKIACNVCFKINLKVLELASCMAFIVEVWNLTHQKGGNTYLKREDEIEEKGSI